MLVVGPNGVGKTNLLEAVHVATQGFSPRTRSDSQVIRFGAEGARAYLDGKADRETLGALLSHAVAWSPVAGSVRNPVPLDVRLG